MNNEQCNRVHLDSGICEPDEPDQNNEEEDLDCRVPDCGPDLDDFTDDEARVYHANDIKIVYSRNRKWFSWIMILMKEYTMICLLDILC